LVISAFKLWFSQNELFASRYLAAGFLLATLNVGPQIIGFAGFYQVWPGLTFFPFATGLWLGPLFYLHAYALIRGEPLAWRKWLLIPGIIQTSYYTWAFLSLGDYKQKWAFNDSFHEPYIVPVESVLEIGLIIFACISVWQLNRRYKDYLDQTESVAAELEPVWLDRIVLAILLGGGTFVGLESVSLFAHIAYIDAFPFQVLIIGVLAWLSIESVWRLNQAFPKIHQIDLASSRVAYKNWAYEFERVEAAVVQGQWFLEQRFSLRELAKRLATNELYVSKSINEGYGQSFNAWINSLRIGHAKHLIKSTDKQLLVVALESGFNSKATFNRVFREKCDLTPSQFKKNPT
jgi:AraC-like DNA-binding protein